MSSDSDFDLGRYLVQLDATECDHWQDELKQIDASDHIEQIFKDVGFEPVSIRDFDPDTPVILNDNGKKLQNLDYIERCRRAAALNEKRAIEREQRQREKEKERAERERQQYEERQRKYEEEARQRREREKQRQAEAQREYEEMLVKLEEDRQIKRQAEIDKNFKAYTSKKYAFTRENIFGMQTIDEDHALYLCAVQTTSDLWCIVILFDEMAYVSSDMLLPHDDRCMKGWFEHLFVYDKLEKHLRKYIWNTSRIVEIGRWLKETKREIMNEFGFGPRDSNTYYCVHKRSSGLLRCNMCGPYPCTLMSCVYYRHCILCDTEIAHSARVWEYHIPEDWI